MNIEFPWSENLPHVDPVADPAQLITPDYVLKSLRCMQNGTSIVVAKILKAAPNICSKIIADLMNSIILEGKVSADWRDNIIFSLFKGRGEASDRNNYPWSQIS